MQYPALIIEKDKIRHNAKLLTEKLSKHGIKVTGVTKVYCAIPEVSQAMVDGGVYALADSRVENFRKLKDINVPKIMLRIPMQSQAAQVVELTDISLNSEVETVKALSQAAKAINKTHGVVLMIDMGDLREGVWHEKAVETAGEIVKLSNIKLLGIGTNLTCYGGVIPTKENLGALIKLGEEIENRFNVKLELISGGNSSSLHLFDKNEMPAKVNQLRLGESILLGFETAYGQRIDGTYRDAFTFAAEIVELQEKPSVPVGEIGMDAFGQKPVFEDKGIIKRAIVAAGRQDVKPDGLTPRDAKIEVLGASSDHMIIDVTKSDRKYKVGDIIEFDVNYGALLAAATSEYVNKVVK